MNDVITLAVSRREAAVIVAGLALLLAKLGAQGARKVTVRGLLEASGDTTALDEDEVCELATTVAAEADLAVDVESLLG